MVVGTARADRALLNAAGFGRLRAVQRFRIAAVHHRARTPCAAEFDAPAATVSHAYRVVTSKGLNARTGPATSYRLVKTYPPNATVQVVCQAPGSTILSTHLWDKLADGSYVSDYYLSTPSKTGYSFPLPRCAYPCQATATAGLRVRSGPGFSYRVTGQLPYGALAWTVCQQAGSVDGTTPVWDQLFKPLVAGQRWIAAGLFEPAVREKAGMRWTPGDEVVLRLFGKLVELAFLAVPRGVFTRAKS